MAPRAIQFVQVLLELAAQDHGAGVFHLTKDLTNPHRVYIIPDTSWPKNPACTHILLNPPKDPNEQQPEHR